MRCGEKELKEESQVQNGQEKSLKEQTMGATAHKVWEWESLLPPFHMKLDLDTI